MNVLAIDPGPVESAWVLWDGSRVLAHAKEPNEVVAGSVLPMHRDVTCADAAAYLVIEMIACYGMAVGAEVFETCVWIGRFMEIFGGQYMTSRLKRGEVKMHLCHSMRAKDGNIRQALIDRFGAPGTKRNPGVTHGLAGDEWAALAVGVTWLDQYQTARESSAL